ncbi:MAG: lipoyl(octanoyl) transferase LipB [Nitrospirae bacterium]|nr:lipoyl(octanoyl) transferase LipB [Nitrospirota bacterium]
MTGPNVVEPQTETTAPNSHRSLAGMVLIFPEPVSYSIVWELQSRLRYERTLNLRPDTVLILEHQPVYTLGRSTLVSHWGGNEDILRANGTELYRVNRGGSVTYHGPGQIVVYPILKLAHHAAGPRQLVWLLEEVIIRLLNLWKIEGYRIDKKPGVWVKAPEPAKIASIGIRVERGVTLHGFALNVDMDLTPFQQIHPCGFTDCCVTSMAAVHKAALPVTIIKHELARIFGAVFALDWAFVEKNPDKHPAASGDKMGRTHTSIV